MPYMLGDVTRWFLQYVPAPLLVVIGSTLLTVSLILFLSPRRQIQKATAALLNGLGLRGNIVSDELHSVFAEKHGVTIAGLTLLLLGGTFLAVSVDAAQAAGNYYTIFGGGCNSVTSSGPCSPPSIFCATVNTGCVLSTNSTLCVSGNLPNCAYCVLGGSHCPADQANECLVTSTNCDTQLFKKGTLLAIQVLAGSVISAVQTITFPTAFPAGTPHVITTFTLDPFTGTAVGSPSNTYSFCGGPSLCTWTNMPAATTEFLGSTNYRNWGGCCDVNAASVYLAVNVAVAGFAGSSLQVQISPDGTTWFDPCTTPNADQVAISSTGIQLASCVLSTTIMSADAGYARIVGSGGNGAVSPQFGLIHVSWQNATIEGVATILYIQATNTNFQFQIQLSAPTPTTISFSIQWMAWKCVAVANSC